mmetsp:Transcript_41382/g.117056  ORF Transcript_41382/g.117056 Transcript_41382/m.117056 type:complete len:274 (+) Transcript_41382:1221-2042(+)
MGVLQLLEGDALSVDVDDEEYLSNLSRHRLQIDDDGLVITIALAGLVVAGVRQAIGTGVVVVHRPNLLADLAEQHRGDVQVDAHAAHVPAHAHHDPLLLRGLGQIRGAALAHREGDALPWRRAPDLLPDVVAEGGLQDVHEVVALLSSLVEPRHGPLAVGPPQQRRDRHDATHTTLEVDRLQGVAMPLLYDVQRDIASLREATTRVRGNDEDDELDLVLDLLKVHPNRLIETLSCTGLVIAGVREAFVHDLESVEVHSIGYCTRIVHHQGLEV